MTSPQACLVTLCPLSDPRSNTVRFLLGLVSRTWSAPGLFLAASGLAGVLHYGYQISMGKLLSVVEYGELGAILSLMLLLTLPASAIDLLITRVTIASQTVNGSQRFPLKGILTIALVSGGFFSLVVIAAAPLLKNILDIDNLSLFVLLALAVLSSYLLASGWGLLRGRHRLLLLSSTMVLYPVLRIIFGILLVTIGLKVFGAFLATLLAIIAVASIAIQRGLTLFPDPPQSSLGETDAEIIKSQTVRSIRAYSLMSLGVAFVVIVVGTIDIIAVKALADPEEAGLYVMASAVGKGGLTVFTSIGLLIFPQVAARHEMGESSTGLLYRALIVGILLLIPFVLAVWLTAPTLISLLFGREYLDGTNILRWYVVAIAPFALITTIARYYLALGDRRAVISLLAFSIALVVVFVFTAEDPMLLIAGTGFTSLAYLIYLLVATFLQQSTLSPSVIVSTDEYRK